MSWSSPRTRGGWKRAGLFWEFRILEIPVILAITGIDEAPAYGVAVDVPALSRLLGVPVVATCAGENRGIPELRSFLREP
jgi:ferrous iron transport protein B